LPHGHADGLFIFKTLRFCVRRRMNLNQLAGDLSGLKIIQAKKLKRY
jgi:hypothetical protein